MDRLVTTPQLQLAIKMLAMSLDELLAEIDRLRKENPLLSVQTRTSRPIGPFPPDLETLPEVYVYLRGHEIFVEANVNAMPDIFVGNQLVPSIEEEADPTTDLVAKFPADQKDHARAAAWIARAVQQRARTYVKIVREIAGRAPAWFKDEYADPPKATIRDVSEAVGMHESTISRVLGGSSDKVLRCERGLVKLGDLIGAKKKEGFKL